MKLKTISKAVIGVATLTASLSGFAANFTLPQNLLGGGDVLFSDNAGTYLINCTPGTSGCNTTDANDTTVDIGDRLRGIFLIDDISGASVLVGSGNDELSGVFDVTVTNKIAGVDVLGLPSFAYEFGSTASFATEFGLGAGAAMAWYVDPEHEFSRESNSGQTAADLESLITDTSEGASLLWSTGFNGNAFWNATIGTDDINNLGLGNIAGGQFIMGLNYIDNLSGLLFNQLSCSDSGALVTVDQCGNGSIITPNPLTGNSTPFGVWDDVNFNSNIQAVPVPAAVWLFGSAMIGLAGFSRRKS